MHISLYKEFKYHYKGVFAVWRDNNPPCIIIKFYASLYPYLYILCHCLTCNSLHGSGKYWRFSWEIFWYHWTFIIYLPNFCESFLIIGEPKHGLVGYSYLSINCLHGMKHLGYQKQKRSRFAS